MPRLLLRDLRLALRTLIRSPGYASVAILALTLGIGATTAVYSIVDGVLLQPLVYAEPDRLLAISSAHPQRGNQIPPSYLDWRDWRERAETLDEIAFVRGEVLMLHGPEGARRLLTGFVSDGFFHLFGTAPALGRTFTPEEEHGNGSRVVVLGHALWTTQFGADREILGRVLRLGDDGYAVVGVMPPGFRVPDFAQLWTPLAPHLVRDPALEQRSFRVDNRALGRLAPDASLAQATDEMRRISSQLAEEHPSTNEDWGVAMVPLRDTVIGNVRALLAILLGASAVVLLIASLNIANLGLVRASARARELAVRTALGASRTQLAGQLLTESLVLAVVGGALGVLLASWGVQLFVGSAPGILPRLDEVSVDLRVLAVCVGVVVVTALIVGTAPALRASRVDLASALREGAAGAGGSGRGARPLRSAFVVAQTALALVLLTGAGLLLRSFYNVMTVDAGFRVEGLTTLRILPPADHPATPEAILDLYAQVRDAALRIPGVQSSALINHLPFAASGVATDVRIPGVAASEQGATDAMYRTVGDGYFETMEMRVVAGRSLGSADMTRSSNALVVNETLANALWPDASAVGRRLTVFKQVVGRDDYREPIDGEVVGVVADVRPFGPEQPAPAEVFVPLVRNPWPTAYLAVRTSPTAPAMVDQLRRAALAVEPNLPMDDLMTMEQRLDGRVAQRRTAMTLLAVFAGVALLLAAIGLYGVIAVAVTQRTREIGVRLALGAEPRRVLALVLRDGMALAAAGILIGAAGAVGATRMLAGMLFQVEPTDPMVFGAIAGVLLAVAAIACVIPARRAASVDPTMALRSE